jgi:methylase of polypeptide subunit release factors
MTDLRIQERLLKIDQVAPNHEPKDIIFNGVSLHVAAGVFDPSKGKSARKMAHALELFPPSKDARVLEIGTGCGVLASLLWLRGCHRILATDIMGEACENARINFSRLNFAIEVKHGDLFEPIENDFDYAIFNVPAAHPARSEASVGATTLWDLNTEYTLKQRFVDGIRSRKPTGPVCAMFMYSSYVDFDPMTRIDFRGFDVSYLLVDVDDISETGVVLLTRG